MVYAQVGPLELQIGKTYVHELGLDGDEDLHIGKQVDVCDEADRVWAATVTDHQDMVWEFHLDL